MTTIVYPLCASIHLIAVLYRAPRLLRSRTVSDLALLGTFVFAFLVWFFVLPWFWGPWSRAAGIPNFAGLLSHTAVILTVACQQILILHLSHNDPHVAWRKAMPRLGGLAAALAAMGVLFGNGIGDHPTDFAVAKAVTSPAYLTVYTVTYTITQIDIARMSWQYARLAPSTWLRRAMRMIIFGTGLLLIYCVGRLAAIVAGLLTDGRMTGHAWEPVTLVAVATGSCVQTISWVMPRLGPRLTALHVRLRRSSIEPAVTRLHQVLVAAVPQVARAIDTAGDPDRRLFRLVIEIRDAQRQLAPWMDPRATDVARRHGQAAGQRGTELAATIEATHLRVAIAAMQQGLAADGRPDTMRAIQPADPPEELLFQRQLARAFSSPTVDAAVTELKTSTTPATEEEDTATPTIP